jgi:hypothetical protein
MWLEDIVKKAKNVTTEGRGLVGYTAALCFECSIIFVK